MFYCWKEAVHPAEITNLLTASVIHVMFYREQHVLLLEGSSTSRGNNQSIHSLCYTCNVLSEAVSRLVISAGCTASLQQ
jgi:hypothetical protein